MRKALLFAMLPLFSCATLFNARLVDVDVDSDPQGARVFVGTAKADRTPTTVSVANDKTPNIQVRARGYSPERCPITTSVGAGYVAADTILCVVLFPIGCISFVDAAGAWNTLSRQSCMINLEALDAEVPENDRPARPPRKHDPEGDQ